MPRQHAYLHSLPHILQMLLQHLLLFRHYSCCWMRCLSPLLQRGQGGHYTSGTRRRDAPVPAWGGSAGRVFTPSLTKASGAGCSLAAPAPGCTRCTVQGTAHATRGERKDGCTPKLTAPPGREHPGCIPGEAEVISCCSGTIPQHKAATVTEGSKCRASDCSFPTAPSTRAVLPGGRRDGGPRTPQPLTWAAVAAVWSSRDSSHRQRATMRAISIGFSKYLLCKRFKPPRLAGAM